MYAFLLRLVTAGEALLDLGCGDGTFVGIARAAGVSAFGLDGDEANVREAARAGLAVVCADVLDLPFPDAPLFDVVTMIHLVEHFEPPAMEDLVRRSVSVLRPGGRLIIMTPNIADWTVLSHVFWLDPTHVRPYPEPLLASVLETAGLRVTHVSREHLLDIGWKQRVMRVFGRLRFGREFERANLTIVGQLP